ncbi:hypothetical protein PMV_321 [Port-miou virus]|uniref:Uncharacterized protein n=1 Tax=Port-miou virus TaxID=1733873 RepID=A0A0N9PVT0_9VIRU|nr:hypothetical protein PMV_321 [Port-miou virus]
MQGTLIGGQCRKHGYYVINPKKEDHEFFGKLLREISHLTGNMKCQREELEEYLSLKKVANAVNKKGKTGDSLCSWKEEGTSFLLP